MRLVVTIEVVQKNPLYVTSTAVILWLYPQPLPQCLICLFASVGICF